MKLKLRASNMPLGMACTNAVKNPERLPAIDTAGKEAKAGSIQHRMAGDIVRTRGVSFEHYRQELENVDAYERAKVLVSNVMGIWNKAYAQELIDPVVEQYYEVDITDEITLTGHPDVWSTHRNEVVAIDWKFGRRRDDFYHQMAAYALLLASQMPANLKQPPVVKIRVIFAEDLDYRDWYTFTVDQLRSWKADLIERMSETRYTPGTHCVTMSCPLYDACPAIKRQKETALSVLGLDRFKVELRNLTPEERGEIYTKMEMVKRGLEAMKVWVKQEVTLYGAMDTGDGHEWRIDEWTERHLLPKIGVPIINEYLTDDEIFELAKISIPKAETFAAHRAMKKGLVGKTAKDAMNKRLNEAGAIYYKKRSAIQHRKIKQGSADQQRKIENRSADQQRKIEEGSADQHRKIRKKVENRAQKQEGHDNE